MVTHREYICVWDTEAIDGGGDAEASRCPVVGGHVGVVVRVCSAPNTSEGAVDIVDNDDVNRGVYPANSFLHMSRAEKYVAGERVVGGVTEWVRALEVA